MSKKEIVELIQLLDIKTSNPIGSEIKHIVESLKLEIENIKFTQRDLQVQLDSIKIIVSEWVQKK